MKKLKLFILLSFCLTLANAQVSIQYEVLRPLPKSEGTFLKKINPADSLTSFSIRIRGNQSQISGIFMQRRWVEGQFVFDEDPWYQPWDGHLQNGEYQATFPILLDPTCVAVYIQADSKLPTTTDSLEFVGMHIPRLAIAPHSRVQSRSSCDSPVWISQQVWRSGLPAPTPGRVATNTHHCIVHHSGGGNGDTNYTELVRSYYTFHTQVNGWDDIGYNFLIAANGDIYAGRDPEKAGIRQDDVLGAHFCGKNSNTMGVCMIGDFSLAQPTAKAMASLHQLLGWKIALDSLDPFGSMRHPDGSGAFLSTVAGHRDGCNTECPGDSLYAALVSIRQEIAGCAVVTSVEERPVSSIRLQPMPEGLLVSGLACGSACSLLDLSGRKVHGPMETRDGQCTLLFPSKGLFLLQIESKTGEKCYLKVML